MYNQRFAELKGLPSGSNSDHPRRRKSSIRGQSAERKRAPTPEGLKAARSQSSNTRVPSLSSAIPSSANRSGAEVSKDPRKPPSDRPLPPPNEPRTPVEKPSSSQWHQQLPQQTTPSISGNSGAQATQATQPEDRMVVDPPSPQTNSAGSAQQEILPSIENTKASELQRYFLI